MADGEVFFISLGSGSEGNSFFLDTPRGALLIDQGFSRRELLARMKRAGCDPSRLRGALLTHEHSDHAKGARVFCDALRLPLYTSIGTATRLARRNNLPKLVRTFEPGAAFDVAGVEISSFALPHDVDTVGFHITCDNVSVGIATDLGCAGESVRRQLANCNALVIESNYDREMLMNSDRTLELKRRICGFRGHLDNAYTAELLAELLGEETGLLLLAHVSRECNDPELLRTVCREKLRELHRDDLRFDILRQDEPSARFTVRA
ncbi:MAG: MBL fold metallo-hydrolase [Lentisphaeria bacterium]|nr:MBL fold metallo-hydrolase [Lentisphaeria bacterium]